MSMFQTAHLTVKQRKRYLKKGNPQDFDLENKYDLLLSKNNRLADEKESLLAEITNLRKQLDFAKEQVAETSQALESKEDILQYQRSKATVFLTIFKVINLLTRLVNDLFGENNAEIMAFGSGVRVLFEFLADQLDENRSHYGDPFIRDIDLRIRASEQIFKQIRNFIEAYAINCYGKVEGLPYVFLNVSPVKNKRSNNIEISYFTLTLHNQRDNQTFHLDISKYSEFSKTNDYDVNLLQISNRGITSQSGNFLDVVESIINRQAKPLFDVEKRIVTNNMLFMLLRQMKLNGYQIVGEHYPLLRRDDVIYCTKNAISIEMKGCSCTTQRFLSLEAIIQYGEIPIKCPLCRELFSGPMIEKSESKKIRFYMESNPFMVRSPERNLQARTYREALIQRLSAPCNAPINPIIVDGEQVKIEEIQPILNLMRNGNTSQRCNCRLCTNNYHISS